MVEVGVDNFKIELVETYPCNSKEELLKREGETIRSLKPSLNMHIPNRTHKEYCTDNQERLKELRAKRYIDNKERVLSNMREYHLENKERRCEYMKQYTQEHTEEIRTKLYAPIVCECGIQTTFHHKARHMKTKVHQKRLILKLETDCQDED